MHLTLALRAIVMDRYAIYLGVARERLLHVWWVWHCRRTPVKISLDSISAISSTDDNSYCVLQDADVKNQLN